MSRARILIIDDDPLVTEVLDKHLSEEGYEVTAVHRGDEGFDCAVKTLPDLILLDVMLPDATGFQMLGRFKENPNTHDIPIIMMSGSARHANQQQISKSMGADAYILKPFDVIQVGDRVNELVEARMPQKLSAPAPDLEAERERKPEFTFEAAPLSAQPNFDVPALPGEFASAQAVPALDDVAPEEIPFAEEPRAEPSPVPLPAMEESPPLQPARAPAPTPVSAPRVSAPPLLWKLTLGMFTAHIVIVMASAKSGAFHAGTLAAGGWGLLLGLLVLSSAIVRIPLFPEEAIRMLGWAAIPIMVRSLGHWTKLVRSPELPLSDFWLRPLDIFELAAMLILGVFFVRLPRSSIFKSIGAVILIALAWCLTSRGYFQPF